MANFDVPNFADLLVKQREAIRDLLRVRVRDLTKLQRVAELGRNYQKQAAGSGIHWVEFDFDRKDAFQEVTCLISPPVSQVFEFRSFSGCRPQTTRSPPLWPANS